MSKDLERVKQIFPPASHKNLEKYFDLIETELNNFIYRKKLKIDSHDKYLIDNYLWATVLTENDKCKPIDEAISPQNSWVWRVPDFQLQNGHLKIYHHYEKAFTDTGDIYHVYAKDYARYEYRKDLQNINSGDGRLYRGRGFIQITGRYNYRLYASIADIPDLENDPSLASIDVNAAKLLVAYVMHNYVRIINHLHNDNLRKAREVVNGKNKHGKPPNGFDAFSRAYKKLSHI